MTIKPDSVLVIEDDEAARRVLVAILKQKGISCVEEAMSAEEVDKKLEQKPFSIIISDYHLGGISGVDMLEHLRKNGNQTPVLLISGIPDLSAVIHASSHKRVDFISKPFNIGDLFTAVERLLTSS